MCKFILRNLFSWRYVFLHISFKICKFPFTDKFCDRNLSIKNQTTTTTDKDDNFFPLEFSLGLPQYYNRARPGVDICKLYKDSNIELCKNGGYCVSVFIGKGY